MSDHKFIETYPYTLGEYASYLWIRVSHALWRLVTRVWHTIGIALIRRG